MKRTLVVLSILSLSIATFAQKGKVTSANNYKESGKLDKALEVITPTLDKSNTSAQKSYAWPRAWEVNGDILVAIGKSKDKKIAALVEDPFIKAMESYKHALELDKKQKNKKGIRNKLIFLESDLINNAIKAHEAENNALAVKYFEATLDMKSLDAYTNGEVVVDTAIIFNTGFCAKLAEQDEKAIKYFKMAEEYNYKPADCQAHVIAVVKRSGDEDAILKELLQAVEKYPTNEEILIAMFNFYHDKGNSEEAIVVLDKAIEQDPTKSMFYLVRGSLLEKMEKWEDAKASYEKAIEVNDQESDAYFNLGIYHYNCGVRQGEVANAVPANDNETYLKEKAKIQPMFEKSLPYLEKALEIKPKQIEYLEALKVVYYRLNMKDKLSNIEAQLDEL